MALSWRRSPIRRRYAAEARRAKKHTTDLWIQKVKVGNVHQYLRRTDLNDTSSDLDTVTLAVMTAT
jgi:hypothetical protein